MHLGEIQRLLKENEPMCICLQHVNTPIPSIGKYNLASSISGEGLLGTAIYVHNKVTYDKITIGTNMFQISSIRLHLRNKTSFMICNIYNQPNKNYDMAQLPNILSQFNEPILVLGDFNAHHPLWNANITEANCGQ